MTTPATTSAKEQSQAPEGIERTNPRPVYRPRVDILETNNQIVLVADMPGVSENGVDITLEKNVLTIRGTVQPPLLEGHTLVYAEYDVGDFERAFTLSDQIDREGIEAGVSNGVLRVTLPKAKKAAAQKIKVQAK
jgi:HSP20 family molecular chaperone IbpA